MTLSVRPERRARSAGPTWKGTLLALLVAACGVKAPPRPPEPERPLTPAPTPTETPTSTRTP